MCQLAPALLCVNKNGVSKEEFISQHARGWREKPLGKGGSVSMAEIRSWTHRPRGGPAAGVGVLPRACPALAPGWPGGHLPRAHSPLRCPLVASLPVAARTGAGATHTASLRRHPEHVEATETPLSPPRLPGLTPVRRDGRTRIVWVELADVRAAHVCGVTAGGVWLRVRPREGTGTDAIRETRFCPQIIW